MTHCTDQPWKKLDGRGQARQCPNLVQHNLNTHSIAHGGPLAPLDVHQLVLDAGLPHGPRSSLQQARAGTYPSSPVLANILSTRLRGLPRTTRLWHSSGYACPPPHRPHPHPCTGTCTRREPARDCLAQPVRRWLSMYVFTFSAEFDPHNCLRKLVSTEMMVHRCS